jgi:polyisoprenyl-teichoic acid--peptidoglycan teichoic acid transferase
MAVLIQTRRPNSRRRKLLTAFLVLLIGLGVVGGVYAWRMINAIVHAEKTAVYPLPPRSNEVALEVTASSTPVSDVDSATAQTPGAAPTTQPSSDPSTIDSIDTPTAAPTQIQLPTGDDPSRISVIQDLIGASVGAGNPGTSPVWGGKSSINIMVLGVDKRPEGGDQNADVIIIAHVDLMEQKVAAVSIPRDLLVEIPGIGPDKINSAYNYGMKTDPQSKVAGVVMMRDTVESVFGVYIDGYIMVDFNGFTEVIDAMGGVTLEVPELIVDPEYPTADFGTEIVRFMPGRQLMDGDRALKYVRTRHQDSDDGRRERQLQVLRALFDKAKSFDSITNGFDVITALGDSVQTGFYLDQQLTLAQIGYAMDDGDIQLSTLGEPLIEGGYAENGAWVYFSDPVEVRAWITTSLSTNFTDIATPTSAGATPQAEPNLNPGSLAR